MENFIDIYHRSLNKAGEELCGDQVRIIKTPDKTTIVLSDGLSSGVKASILATLTTDIIATMVREDTDLREVLSTVIRTLPVDQERRIAYATFTILTIDHKDNQFRLVNFDNPEPFYLKNGSIRRLNMRVNKILGKKLFFADGSFELNDFIGLVSDGILYAGLGTTMNFGWGWENVAKYMEQEVFRRKVFAAHSVVNSVVSVTNQLYHFSPGDDATFVGVLARKRNSLMILSGPPIDDGHDYIYVDKLLDFNGRKAICGGTTANIVAGFLKAKVETELSTMRPDIPAIGRLPGIDLVTEGILTLAATLDLLQQSEGSLDKLQLDNNGAYLLTREMLAADAIHFLVGQSINPFYQNPLLPKNISIRRYLIERIAEVLDQYNKDVNIELC
ncbi:MAG: SpoIIE family protein phosphatase [Chloroflexi bacterium]|nr:SpoIIE family protein phosphatase [Anaerolineaceae bacterium]NMB90564.1 SpoIIE family protein phosphatase [Chloroflexota bacterium]